MRLNEKFNWGKTLSLQNPELFRQLDQVYTDLATKSNSKTNKVVMSSDPSNNTPVNQNFDVGDEWINKKDDTVWIMTSRTTAEAVTWKKISM